jgi:hypothetical protein
MRKVTIIFLLILAAFFLFCDAEKLFRKSPVIEEMTIQPEQVNPFDTVYAEVKATNPEEGILSYEWSVSPDQGVFLDAIDDPAVHWVAPTAGGDYTFKVKVSNSYKSTERDESVKVIEAGLPIVRILSPEEGDYFIQLNEIDIRAEAFHNNGINKVSLYIDDQLISERSGTASDQYNFQFTPDTTYLGKTEIKISALANFSLTQGADSISFFIEGILPGKDKYDADFRFNEN